MSFQQNTDRIQTTHIGSLPRPHALLDIMKAKYGGQPYNRKNYDEMVAESRRRRPTHTPTRGSGEPY